MLEQTISALSAINSPAGSSACIDTPEAAKALGLAVDCELASIASIAALALAGESEFPNALRSYGACMAKAIGFRLAGAIGHAITQERRADAFFDQLPRGFQW